MSATWVVIAFMLIVALMVFGTEIWQEFRAIQARSWPVGDGLIQSGYVDVVKGTAKKPDYAIGKITYSYTVSGDYYSGQYEKRFNTVGEAQEFVDFVNAKLISVRYNPRKIGSSIIRDEDQKERLGI